jgi:hypothetical protein
MANLLHGLLVLSSAGWVVEAIANQHALLLSSHTAQHSSASDTSHLGDWTDILNICILVARQ